MVQKKDFMDTTLGEVEREWWHFSLGMISWIPPWGVVEREWWWHFCLEFPKKNANTPFPVLPRRYP